MRIPKRLQSLVDDGLVDEVIRPLMSGKEASVLVVRSGGEIRCAKVYKEAKDRNFRQRSNYEEGRSVRNSRRARAMAKRTKYGKQELEEAWQNTEVDTIYKLARAGVRVPTPHMFSDGILVMELVVDSAGNAAPRLNDIVLSAERARTYHAFMLNQIVRMLCAGLIHGDLSEYNVLVGADGLVVIDFPQAMDAAGNNNARRMFLRDVDNLAAYFGRFAPELKRADYGKEIWKLYERGELHPEVELTGQIEEDKTPANVDGVMREIEEAREEHARRFGRKVVEIAPPASRPRAKQSQPGQGKGRPRGRGPRSNGTPNPATAGDQGARAAGAAQVSGLDGASAKKRRRRRRRKPAGGADIQSAQGRPSQQGPGPANSGAHQQASADDPNGGQRKRRRRRRRKSQAQQAPLT